MKKYRVKNLSTVLVQAAAIVALMAPGMSVAAPRDAHMVGRAAGNVGMGGATPPQMGEKVEHKHWHHAKEEKHESEEARAHERERYEERREERREERQEHRKEMMEKRKERREEREKHRKEMMEKRQQNQTMPDTTTIPATTQ